MMYSPQEIMLSLGQRLRERRLAKNLSQSGLSERSGVSLAVVRLFERTGKISLESLVKLAIALGCEEAFETLFVPQTTDRIVSLDELLKQNQSRKRGRSR